MMKNLLRLLAASASFVALLLVANTAIAAPKINNSLAQTVNQTALQQVSLNVISPDLELINEQNNSMFDHLGCSCSICTQAVEKTKINI